MKQEKNSKVHVQKKMLMKKSVVAVAKLNALYFELFSHPLDFPD